jgi:hypothetical protein
MGTSGPEQPIISISRENDKIDGKTVLTIHTQDDVDKALANLKTWAIKWQDVDDAYKRQKNFLNWKNISFELRRITTSFNDGLLEARNWNLQKLSDLLKIDLLSNIALSNRPGAISQQITLKQQEATKNLSSPPAPAAQAPQKAQARNSLQNITRNLTWTPDRDNLIQKAGG